MKSVARVLTMPLILIFLGLVALAALITFAANTDGSGSDTATAPAEQTEDESPTTTQGTTTTTTTTTRPTTTTIPFGDEEQLQPPTTAVSETAGPPVVNGELTVFPGPDGRNAYIDEIDGYLDLVWVDTPSGELEAYSGGDSGHLFTWYRDDFFGIVLDGDGGELVAFSEDNPLDNKIKQDALDFERGFRLRLPRSWDTVDINSWADPESQSTLTVRLVDESDNREFTDVASLSDGLVPVWSYPDPVVHLFRNDVVGFVDAVDETIIESDGTRIIRRIQLADRTLEYEAFVDVDAPDALEDVLFMMTFSEIFELRFDLGRDRNEILSRPIQPSTKAVVYEVRVRYGAGDSDLEVAVPFETFLVGGPRSSAGLRTTESVRALRSEDVVAVPRPDGCAAGCETVLWITEGREFGADHPGSAYVFYGDPSTEVSMTEIDTLPPQAFR